MSEEIDIDELEIVEQTQVSAAPTQALAAPVVDFSSLSDSEQAQVGGELERQVQDDSAQVMARYLRIGRNLYLISKHKLYEKMGHASFDGWRAQPDLNLARSTTYGLMKVFETFVERLRVDPDKLAGLDWTKLYAVARFVDPSNVDEFIEKVRTLSRTDLQSEISNLAAIAQGKTPAQAAAQQAVIDVVREACPIGCGAKCGLIQADEDAAVVAFKKFLGGWRGLSAKIRGLYGKTLSPAQNQNEPKKNDASPEAVPPEPDGLSPDDIG